MNLADELRQITQLHQEGHLTDAEFVEAKQQALASRAATTSTPPTPHREVTGARGPDADRRFYSSRWSSGNLFFPDSLTLAGDSMLFQKGAMFGSSEERINYRAVASFRVKHGLFLSTISIETSGGSQPIVVNGLWKSAAKEIQEILRSLQTGG